MKKLEPLCHELAPLRGARCVSAAPPPAALPNVLARTGEIFTDFSSNDPAKIYSEIEFILIHV
jgi:hypothetical protein